MTLASLNHPNIAAIYDVQEAGVGNAVGDEALDIAGDLRGDDFGMIEGRD